MRTSVLVWFASAWLLTNTLASQTLELGPGVDASVSRSGEALQLGQGSLLSLDAGEFRVDGEGLTKASSPDWRAFRSPETEVQTTIRRVRPDVLHVEWNVRFTSPVRLREVAARFRFLPSQAGQWEAARQGFHWIPNIKAKPGQIAADHVFRSPAVMVQSGESGVAIIPDLDVLRADRPAPHFLDLQFPRGEAPFVEYGIAPSAPEGHTYYRRTGETFSPAAQMVRFACYVLVRQKTSREQLTGEAVRFLWSRYASAYTSSVKPQTVPFATYAEYGYDMALRTLWVNGPTPSTGGITLSTYLNPKTGRSGGRLYEDDLWYHSWFNNLRTAWGLYYWGKALDRPEWQRRAGEIARLILEAPRKDGLFATIYKSTDRTWQSSGQGGGADVFHLPDNAWTALWLLRYQQECEPLPGAREFLIDFTRALVRLQYADGAFPARVRVDSLQPDTVLDRSASAALPLWFLAEMWKRNMLPPDLKTQVADALQRGADDLCRRILPAQQFDDFELYLSCSKKPLDFYDDVTAMHGQNTLSMQWSAEALLLAHKLLGKSNYLEAGKFCVDLLSLYQQIWNPPYLTLYGFGGFGVMNTDAEWNDARQAQFAETFVNFYEATGERMYFERAIAAARASFALVVMDENKDVAPRNYKGVQKNSETKGGSAENYGHRGRDLRAYQSGFHWGTGSALTTAAVLQSRYGDLFLDPQRREAFGINGLVVKQASWQQRPSISVESVPGRRQASGKIQVKSRRIPIVTVNQKSVPVAGDGKFSFILGQ